MSSDQAPDEARLPFSEEAKVGHAPPHLEEQVVERLRKLRLIDEASTKRTSRARWAWAASVAAAFLIGWNLQSNDIEPAANFMLLLHRVPGENLSDAEMSARIAEYGAWAGELASKGALVAAERLLPGEARFGPDHSAQSPSGFFLLRVDNEEEARSAARDCPHLRHGGSVALHAIDEELSSSSR